MRKSIYNAVRREDNNSTQEIDIKDFTYED
jgi:hypothetical protein